MMTHLKRWLTSIILVPLLLWLLIKGNSLMVAAAIALISVFALREYLTIIFNEFNEKSNEKNKPFPTLIWLISCLTSILFTASAYLNSLHLLLFSLIINFIILVVYLLTRFPADEPIFSIIMRQLLGIIYISLPLSLLMFIYNVENGVLWIIWLFIAVFMNDTCAFYAGTFFGKKKLAPKISPNKTLEGSLGGIGGAVLTGFIAALLFFHDFSLSLMTIPCAFLLAISGQIGDLFESTLKRASSLKDSGSILPGHGGILDRIDGLLLAIPVFYAYLVFVL